MGMEELMKSRNRTKERDSPIAPASPWEDFRVLCGYYAECVQVSERPKEILPLDREHDLFCVAHPPVGWLGETPFEITLDRRRELLFIDRILTRKQFDETFYVGYPCEVIKGERDLFAVPILLIPAEIHENDTGRWEITLDIGATHLNHSWLDFNVPQEERSRVLTRFYNRANGEVNFEIACAEFSQLHHREVDPNQPEAFLRQKTGFANVAVLGVGMKLKYSKTLRRELLHIRQESDDVLDRTALAYVFRNPPLPNEAKPGNERAFPANFLSSNLEQQRALIEALSKPCTRIQGPPGTGKSQAAVNLLLNLAYRGQSVLFTSRNHRAIHAIEDKISRALSQPTQSVDLTNWVQFCSNEDGSARQTWSETNLENMRNLARLINYETPSLARQQVLLAFNEGLEDWADAWEDLEHRQVVLRHLETAEALVEVLESGLRIPEETNLRALRIDLRRLARHPRTRLERLVWRILRYERRQDTLEATLRNRFPNISAPRDKRIFYRRLLRQSCRLAHLRRARVMLAEQRNAAAELPPYGPLLERTAKASKQCTENQLTALLARICNRAHSIDPNLIQSIAATCARFRLSNLPFLATVITPERHNEVVQAFAKLTQLYPIWACTLLSLTKASPCNAALFDRVVIDEAAQCDIPPMIPALFRAKGVTVIGDPQQFPPVINLPKVRHRLIQRRHRLLDQRFAIYDYTKENAYSVVHYPAILLTEHFRCAQDIIDYCSETYYGGKLIVLTDQNKESDSIRRVLGHRPALDWVNVVGTIEDEIQTLKSQLDGLVNNLSELPEKFSIGIITPFRKLAERLKTQLHPYATRLQGHLDPDHVNTVNAFQGGECDLIFIVLGLTDESTNGEIWYATNDENAYIYNVAVSRAKVSCIIIGDRKRALLSGSTALSKLAAERKRRKPKADSIGPGEKVLEQALRRLGLNPEPQYPLGSRWLDLALVDSQIDIEVDGRSYHLNGRGERKQDDFYRDNEVRSRGWMVSRHWHNDVMNDPDAIAREILALHQSRLRKE